VFSIIIGVILSGILFFSAAQIAAFYNNDELILIAKLLSLTVLFSALRIVPNALLLKELKFKQVSLINISVLICSGTMAVILAYKGFSYFAIVYKSIFDSFFLFIILLWLAPLKFKLQIKYSALRKIMKFSTYQFLFNFINYFSRNTDNLLIGKYIGPAALGYYEKSYKLMGLPVQNLTHVITPVLLPVLSNIQDDKKKVYDAYLKVVKVLAIIGFPLSIFLYFAASEIILILYGPQWVESIAVFKILALTVGIQMVLSSSGSIFQTVNRTDLLFLSGFLSAILMVLGICYGVFIGKSLISIGYGLIFAFMVNFFQAFYILINRALGLSLWSFLKSLIYPLIMALSVFVALHITTYFSFSTNLYSLVLKSLTALLTFALTFFINKHNRDLFYLIRNKKLNDTK
jgi:PST family polysaccharide transporter